MILAWAPTDNFTAMFKAEHNRRKSEGDTNNVCRGLADDQEFLRDGERAVLIRGLVPAYDALMNQLPIPDCVTDGFTRWGIPEGTNNPMNPIPGINNTDGRTGSVNTIHLMRQFIPDGDLGGA